MRIRPHIRTEKALAECGYSAVVGLDEVGRGAWAGPLVVGAVIMPLQPHIQGVRDSKLLTPPQRERLAARIRAHAQNSAIGIVSAVEIDQMGITRANIVAMIRAIEQLSVQPDFLLIDALDLREWIPIEQLAIINGDATIYSIACASIMAKVARDQMMREYHEQFPQYGFHEHKGYGTAEHEEQLVRYGLSHIHRLSFHPMKTMV